MNAFLGFPKPGVGFLSSLAKNNNTAWFHAHKADYEAHLKLPALHFLEALSDSLGKVWKKSGRVHSKLFRINRDIRFSADKRPYKEHLAAFLWDGEAKECGTSALYFRLEAHRLMIGAGTHQFEDQALAGYRNAVVSPSKGAELAKVVGRLKTRGYDIGGQHYKKVPKGFDQEHPRAGLLLHNALHAGVEMKLPKEVYSAALVGLCVKHYQALTPLHRWISGL